MLPNGFRLAAVGDLEALHCQPSTNFDRSTALELTTSTPIAANRCWRLVYLNILLSNGNLSILVIVIFEKSI
jgi:hypothetical protein